MHTCSGFMMTSLPAEKATRSPSLPHANAYTGVAKDASCWALVLLLLVAIVVVVIVIDARACGAWSRDSTCERSMPVRDHTRTQPSSPEETMALPCDKVTTIAEDEGGG